MAITTSTRHAITAEVGRAGHEPIPWRLGTWHCVRMISAGTMHRVYAARPEACPAEWPLDYAIKVLQPHLHDNRMAIQCLQREAALGKCVKQQHLVPLLSSSLDEPPFYLVYPRVPGRVLNDLLGSQRALTTPFALWIVRQTAEALRALHQTGWRHGDIKPENIIVGHDGHTTLIDLGLAQRFHDPNLAADRAFGGSLHYVAPECFSSRLTHDAKSDIYSLGIMLFECLAGRKPFEQASPEAVVDAHRCVSPPNLRRLAPWVPSTVVDLVRRMLAKNPLRRPPTADALIRGLLPLEVETFFDHVAPVS